MSGHGLLMRNKQKHPMESDLEKRFKYLKEEKQKDLVQKRRTPVEMEEEPESGGMVKKRFARFRKVAREMAWFLGALAVSYGLGFFIREHLVDNILEGRFRQQWDWLRPPDEKSVALEIQQEFWRAHGFLHLYSLVCLLGCYLTRATTWAINNILPEIFGEEQQGT